MTSLPARQPPLWLLVLITISGTMAMHMFVPALPLAASDLGATAGQTQMTISFYILGLAVGQLFYGPLSDSFGRRPLLMVGLAMYAVGGLTAALASEIHVLVGARLVQALGGCAGLALGRAIVRDSSRADETVKKLALLNLMMMISPGLSPMIGSLVSGAAGWRAVFWLLAGLGILTSLLAWKLLPETGPSGGKVSARAMLRDYRALLGSRQFVGLAIGGACATTSVYAFIAIAPFLFHTQLHRPLGEVGLYLSLLVFGMSLGNIVTGRLVGRVGTHLLTRSGNLLSTLGALVFLGLIICGSQSVAWIMVSMLLFTCGVGITGPTALANAMNANPRLTGSAAGLYGFTQMLIGAICTSLVALGRDPAMAAAVVLVGAMAISLAAFWWSKVPRGPGTPADDAS